MSGVLVINNCVCERYTCMNIDKSIGINTDTHQHAHAHHVLFPCWVSSHLHCQIFTWSGAVRVMFECIMFIDNIEYDVSYIYNHVHSCLIQFWVNYKPKGFWICSQYPILFRWDSWISEIKSHPSRSKISIKWWWKTASFLCIGNYAHMELQMHRYSMMWHIESGIDKVYR